MFWSHWSAAVQNRPLNHLTRFICSRPHTRFSARSFFSITSYLRDMSSHYQNVVIGSGQGGTPLSSALAAAGQRTALVESTHIGGTCINVGCTPTKTMVASARVAYLARRGKEYGVHLPDNGQVRVDLETVRNRKRSIVNSFRGGSERRLRSAKNLDWITGIAKFITPHELEISASSGSEKRVISADRIFIDTGCYPSPLTIAGADTVDVLNSTTVMELASVPEHLIVIGGGYVGCEFSQMFRRFGSEVTIVQRAPKLLGREDQDVADGVRDIFVEDGITIHFSSSANSVSRTHEGGIKLSITTPSGSKEISATHLLAAAGRTPNTAALDLPAAGVNTNSHGFITTDEYFKTSVPHIYALGDVVAGNPQFTHISYDDFRILRDNLLEPATGKTKRSRNNRQVPYTVFIDPQLGRIGLSESAARAMDPYSSNPDRIRTAKMPMSYVARALETDEARGFIKVVIDVETGKILGAAVLGLEGGEVMTMLQIAMMGGVGWEELADATFAHPGLGEMLNNVWRA